MKRRFETSFGASIPVVGRAEPPEPGHLLLLAEIFLTVRGVEWEAEEPPGWFGRTRGSAGPLSAPLASPFGAGAGMTTNGILAMCSASWSISMTAMARFAGEGSPSRANVDEASLDGMIALQAMENDQSCGGDESKKIKMEVRKTGEGKIIIKPKTGRKFPF